MASPRIAVDEAGFGILCNPRHHALQRAQRRRPEVLTQRATFVAGPGREGGRRAVLSFRASGRHHERRIRREGCNPRATDCRRGALGWLRGGCGARASIAFAEALAKPEASVRLIQVSCEGAVFRAHGPPGTRVRSSRGHGFGSSGLLPRPASRPERCLIEGPSANRASSTCAFRWTRWTQARPRSTPRSGDARSVEETGGTIGSARWTYRYPGTSAR